MKVATIFQILHLNIFIVIFTRKCLSITSLFASNTSRPLSLTLPVEECICFENRYSTIFLCAETWPSYLNSQQHVFPHHVQMLRGTFFYPVYENFGKSTSRHVVFGLFVNRFISLMKNWTAPFFDPAPFVSNILITVHAKCIQ